jgi:tetratricopeptide (TPR) repeat protein
MTRSLVLGFFLMGASILARAETAPEVQDSDTSPYHLALTAYKSGHYDAARKAIDAAEIEKPGDFPTEILKSRILSELGDFAGAKTALESLNKNPAVTPELRDEQTLAFGDMNLHKRSFDEAAKFYESLLSRKPNDPDLILKIVYTRVGASDLVAAGQYASKLSPMDPKNPYDTHASYYFAKAALAHATGNSQEEEDEIQSARTIYGITVANHYLKTYLEVFTQPDKTPASQITPPPLIQPAPKP